MASGIIVGSTSNKYIDCQIVWSSTVNSGNNTSTVTAELQYRRNNTGWVTSGTGNFYITINGTKTSVTKSVRIIYDFEKWQTVATATQTVTHSIDGTKSITITGGGQIPPTTLTESSCSGTAVLDTTSRASTISYVSDVALGNFCTVRWTPKSKDFHFKMQFMVGFWTYTTGAIHPNVDTLYTNASYRIPLEAANQFLPNSTSATMYVTLYTYSDEECTNQIGTSSTMSCKASILETIDTKPQVEMSLSPSSSLSEDFNGLYIQNKTKVQVNFDGTKGQYGATIKSYSVTVDKKRQSDPYLSDLISTAGKIFVSGTVTDSRGFSSVFPQPITVIAYSKPSVAPYTGANSIVCKRCDAEGNISDSGTYLRIKAGRQYSTVTADDVQKNFCTLRFRYKPESATEFSNWTTLLAKENTDTNEVDAVIGNVASSVATSYTVQIGVIDEIGEEASLEFTIPTAQVTIHLKQGGKGVGIGMYSKEDNVVAIAEDWDVKIGGTLYPTHIASIPAIDTYSNKDFNELIYHTGYYTGSGVPSTVSCDNYPIDETGILEVISAMNQNGWGFAYQTYRTNTGKVYMRSYYSSTGWTAWKQVAYT